MTKQELVVSVSEKTGETQKNVKNVINAFCNAIIELCVENCEEVCLPSFGTFKSKVSKGGKRINPFTGKEILVKEKHSIIFKPSTGIKKTVEE